MNNYNEEINYKTIFENSFKNNFLVFPFIDETVIDLKTNKIDNRLKIYSTIINFNNDLIKDINKKNINCFNFYNKLRVFTKRISFYSNEDEITKELELIKYLIINVNSKLNQDDIDEIEYNIYSVNQYYDNAEILSYMQIENDFYFDIASRIRMEDKNDSIDTLLILLNNKNLSIHRLTKAAAIKYYGTSVKQGLIDNLVEEIIKSYNKDKSLVEHIKETVSLLSQKENEKKYLINK